MPYNSDAREEVRQRQSVNEREQRGDMLERYYVLGYLLGPTMLLTCQQFLEAGIVADRVPDWIDFQARDGNGFTRRDGEKFFQILHRFRGSTGLRLNLGQGGQVSGTKHCVFFGWQQIECLSGRY